MKFEKKIQKELNRLDDQWYDAVCPDVAKFGRQADKRIAELEAEVARLREGAVKVAEECMHHYLGGYQGSYEIEVYRHGMQTVINAISHWAAQEE